VILHGKEKNMKKVEIAFLISDAINIGFDNHAELLGFCKGLEVLGRKDLADKVMGLYKSRANDDTIVKFVSENFKEVKND
jgi:hypothetical protein